MADSFRFKKKKEFLVCVDSDGCAMDTMEIKHRICFGPCLVKTWGLEACEGAVLERWNEINLYSATRGINRFKALAAILEEMGGRLNLPDGTEALEKWVREAAELSEGSLEAYIAENGENSCLRNALNWSRDVNRSIARIKAEEKKPFPGVKEALAYAENIADVVVVSSANLQAVTEEWERCGLAQHTGLILAQDAGSKARCIEMLLECGYEKDKVLMVGDAKGDLDAALKNGVLYYPILVRREEESWREFLNAADRLAAGEYAGGYQEMMIGRMKENLGI